MTRMPNHEFIAANVASHRDELIVKVDNILAGPKISCSPEPGQVDVVIHRVSSTTPALDQRVCHGV